VVCVAGADVAGTNDAAATPLHLAAFHGHNTTVSLSFYPLFSSALTRNTSAKERFCVSVRGTREREYTCVELVTVAEPCTRVCVCAWVSGKM